MERFRLYDIQLGYMINKLNMPVFKLDQKFNHMSLFSESGRNWLNSYIIHYAGSGFYKNLARSEQMKKDLKLIEKYHKDNFPIFINLIPRLRLILIGLYGYYEIFMKFFGRKSRMGL